MVKSHKSPDGGLYWFEILFEGFILLLANGKNDFLVFVTLTHGDEGGIKDALILSMSPPDYWRE